MDNVRWHRISAFTDNYIWLLEDCANNVVIVVDPGDAVPVLDYCKAHNLNLSHIIITHHHRDHTGGVDKLRSVFGAHVIGSKSDKQRLPKLDQEVSAGDELRIGSFSFEVEGADGHTNGHILYFETNNKWIFVGDTLFAMGCGRMFEGTPQDFTASLKKIMARPSDTLVFCAHEYTLSNSLFALAVDPENEKLARRSALVKNQRQQDTPTVPFHLQDELETNPFLRFSSNSLITALKQKKALTSENPEDYMVFTVLRKMKDEF